MFKSLNVGGGLAVSLGAVLALVGCGRVGVKDFGRPYTAEEITSRFKDLTGDELRPEGKVLDLRRLGGVMSVSLSVPESLWKKYGEFRYVVVSGKATTPEGELLDPSRPDGGKPDENGVYWSESYNERSADQRPYWAATAYRGNVTLIWFPPSRRRESTPSFKKLQEVLASLRRQS